MTDERQRSDPEMERAGGRRPEPSGGALTGASGSLTPDDGTAEAFVPAERREIADPDRAGSVTAEERRHAALGTDPQATGSSVPSGGATGPAQGAGGYGAEGGLATDDPAYRVDVEPDAEPRASGPRVGDSDTYHEGEERF